MDQQKISQARQYHLQRQKMQLARQERLRQERYKQVQAAIRRLAPDYPALQAVHLFGSLVRTGQFGLQSDIDVAVRCNNIEEESRFWQALEAELGHPVDLRPYQGAVAWAVDTYGVCVYEREVSNS